MIRKQTIPLDTDRWPGPWNWPYKVECLNSLSQEQKDYPAHEEVLEGVIEAIRRFPLYFIK